MSSHSQSHSGLVAVMRRRQHFRLSRVARSRQRRISLLLNGNSSADIPSSIPARRRTTTRQSGRDGRSRAGNSDIIARRACGPGRGDPAKKDERVTSWENGTGPGADGQSGPASGVAWQAAGLSNGTAACSWSRWNTGSF